MRQVTPKARLLAYYLPQYHPIPENDTWWGKGFTEWHNVARARPLFENHQQPHLPADLGFYDLRLPEVRIAQAEMARDFGIEGFCYWHYWFGGKRLLERPFQEVLHTHEPDFPFCLAWANQSWSGIWHGAPEKILMEQTYPGPEDDKAHFKAVLEAFKDPRYMTVNGCPLFILFRPQEHPFLKIFIERWRELAHKAGLKGLYFVSVSWSHEWRPESYGFDAAAPNNFNHLWNLVQEGSIPNVRQDPLVIRYRDAVANLTPPLRSDFVEFPSVFPNWDNTPRAGIRGRVFADTGPDLLKEYLENALRQVESRPMDERIIFLKSWNEWAEGNYLEPDTRNGYANLEAIRQVIY